MYILGISAFYHDSAACLVRDGDIIAAAQEERFSRIKHDYNFPVKAIEYCLQSAGITGDQLDFIAFYDKPFIKFERILQTYLTYAPRGLRSFLKAMPLWLKKKLWLKDFIAEELRFNGKILFPEHHQSHAASAFFPSPFTEAAFLTIDGVGEWTTASYGKGEKNNITIWGELNFPHSLGLLYSAFTYFTGFKVNSGEYKLMGLAPYGEPVYTDLIKEELLDLKPDGSFRMNMKYFDYCAGLTMTNKRFNRLFDGPPRKPESPISQREMDLARSIQEVTEEIMLKMADHVYQQTAQKNLVLAGGVSLNCVGNGHILRNSQFEDIWIQPAAGDAGGALGAALFVWYQYLGKERKLSVERDHQKSSYLGPVFSNDDIKKFLIENDIAFTELTGVELPDVVSDLLIDEKVVGWYQGRMEFGPRALGNRSILGDARSANMQSVMNLKIKFRESFRPFAPSILLEKVSEYFELDRESPYMLLVAPINHEHRLENLNGKARGLDKLKIVRSEVPAVTHVDYTARIQTVKESDNPRYYRLLKTFYRKTGCPVIINTSFNVRGEPIVCTPEEAFLCFQRTEMDYLIMGNYLLNKKKQITLEKDIDWKKQFELD